MRSLTQPQEELGLEAEAEKCGEIRLRGMEKNRELKIVDKKGGMTQLWQGGWIFADEFETLKKTFDSSSTMCFSHSLPTYSVERRALARMTPRFQPDQCEDECIETGKAFPAYLTFETCHAKEVEDDSSTGDFDMWLVPPGLPYKIGSLRKILNDPWQDGKVWTPKRMAKWLSQKHEVPKSWEDKPCGPWPKIADAVMTHSLDGPAFLTWFDSKEFPQPYLKEQPWDQESSLISKKRSQLEHAAMTRYQLPKTDTIMGPGVNPIRYYYNITLRDAEPCK